MGKSINDMKMPDFGNMAKGMVQGGRERSEEDSSGFRR